MDDRLSRLESRVESLSRALKRIEDRLASLEKSAGAAPGVALPSPAPEAVGAPTDSEIARGIAFMGRTLLVLGGAYLLRTLTESGTVAPLAGVALGLAYALFWLVVADRAGAKARASSAAFHGAAAVLVAFPLLWETTARFDLLAPPWSAASLALVSGVAVGVAWRRRLRSFAWVTLIGATLTSLLLLGGTRDLVSFSLVLVLLGVATLWLSYHSAWPAVHWVVAGIADVAVVLVGVGAVIGRGSVEPAGALVVQLALFSLFLGSILYRVVQRRHDPRLFELIQTVLVISIGFGGALRTSSPVLGSVLGGIGVVLGLASYRVSFSSSKLGPRATVYVGLVGLLLLLLGGAALPVEPTLSFSLAAVGLSWLGSRFDHPIIRLHGAAFVLAAAVSSGLLVHAAFAFAAPASFAWPPVGLWLVVSLLAATLAYLLPAASRNEPFFEQWRVARLLDLAVAVAAFGGLMLTLVATPIAGRPGEGADAAFLATARTAVLALSAVALGWLGRADRFREASWLVYPLLVAGGIKFAVEDFIQGRAVTLFVGLALYGGALILAPRVARSPSSSS